MRHAATLLAIALQLALATDLSAQPAYVYTDGHFELPPIALPQITTTTNFVYPAPPVQYTGQPPNGCVWAGAPYSDGATIVREVKASYVWRCVQGSWKPYGSVGEAFNPRPARITYPVPGKRPQ